MRRNSVRSTRHLIASCRQSISSGLSVNRIERITVACFRVCPTPLSLRFLIGPRHRHRSAPCPRRHGLRSSPLRPRHSRIPPAIRRHLVIVIVIIIAGTRAAIAGADRLANTRVERQVGQAWRGQARHIRGPSAAKAGGVLHPVPDPSPLPSIRSAPVPVSPSGL